jgi:hypothetical protein
MALPVTITGISTAVAPVGPFKLAAGNYASVGITTGAPTAALKALQGAGTANEKLCQTFTNGASAMTIGSITIQGSKNQTPTDDLVVDITATNAAGAVLGTSDPFPGASVPASAGYYTINFSTPVTVAGGATFGVVFRRSGGGDTFNYFTITGGNTNSYAGGSWFIYNGSTWTDQATDLVCTVNKLVTVSDTFYFFGRDGTTATTLQAFKSTAPDTSWASVATKTGFTTAILNLASYQVGPVIHLLVQDGTASTSLATKYVSFDMTNDTFLATTETVSAAVAVTGQVAGVGASASLVVRSNGEVVAFYNGVQTKTSGTFRARVYYRRRTAVNTYGTETQVDANTATDNTTPIAVLGAADRVHFIWSAAANTGYRTLSAANALNTAGSSGSMSPPGDGCSYDRSGTTKVVVTSNGGGQSTMRFDSSDNPTPSFANQSIAAASVPHRIGSDPVTDDVTIVYRSTADSDLYAIKSSDDGATFGAPVSFFVGTVANNDVSLSRNASGGVYQRGSSIVVGYIVNDNGTLKYNENVLSFLGSIGSAAGVGAATGASAATAADAVTAAGTGASSVKGTGIVSSTASAAGTSASSNVKGTAITGKSVTAAGSSGATAVGASVVVSVRAVVSWLELEAVQSVVTTANGIGTASGVGAASAVGAETAASVGTASGTGAANTVATGLGVRTVSAAGTGAAAGAGVSIAAGIGNAVGTGAASASIVSVGQNVGNAAGVGTANAVGATALLIVSGVGTAAGTSTANAPSSIVEAGVGAAAGVGTASSLSFYFSGSAFPLVPDTDNTDGGWTNETGGTVLYSSIDEAAPNDSDYIISSDRPVSDICKISLSDPAGGIQAPLAVFYRFKKSGPNTINLRVRLLEGSTQISSWTHNNIADDFISVEQMLSSGELASITNPNNLFLEFKASV